MLRLPFLPLWQTPLTTGIWRGSWPSVHSSLNFQQSGWIKLSLIMLWGSIWVPRCASFWIHHSNPTQRFRVWYTTLMMEVSQIHSMEICWACSQKAKDQAFFLTGYAHNQGMLLGQRCCKGGMGMAHCSGVFRSVLFSQFCHTGHRHAKASSPNVFA